MGRNLCCYLLDGEQKEVRKWNNFGGLQKVLIDIDQCYHYGNVYGLYKYFEIKSEGQEESIFTLEKINEYINNKAKNYSYSQLLSYQLFQGIGDEILSEIHLLSYIYEESKKLNNEGVDITFVKFTYC